MNFKNILTLFVVFSSFVDAPASDRDAPASDQIRISMQSDPGGNRIHIRGNEVPKAGLKLLIKAPAGADLSIGEGKTKITSTAKEIFVEF